MAWKVKISDNAKKELRKLDKQMAERILAFFRDRFVRKGLDPRSIGDALEGSKLGEFWRYRIGDWRAICKIQDDQILIIVLKIDHRRQVYR
jgi:mRNA interferase RelE/StbE